MTFKIENYTRTDNPDGSVTFKPIKASKRFVPKEGEDYFYVSGYGGEVQGNSWSESHSDKRYLAMGNVYRTKEDAEKARDKQLALVRIQNYIAGNDLGREFVEGEDNYSIYYDHINKCFDWHEWQQNEHYNPIGYLKSPKACPKVIENCTEDLLIVWGRK